LVVKDKLERPDEMIVYANWISSFKEYQLAGEKIQAGIELPEKCPRCQGLEVFWRHGKYQRRVREKDGESVPVKIYRYICKVCAQTVSCLYGFLAAYRQYAVSVVAEAVEAYATKATTYRELSWAADAAKSAEVSTIFCWVRDLSRQAEQLLPAIQKEMPLDLLWQEKEAEIPACLNACKAKSEGKKEMLHQLAELVALTARWFGAGQGLICLHEYMVAKAETCQSIMSGHKLRLSAPQKMKHLSF
jgi:transposase-like protein